MRAVLYLDQSLPLPVVGGAADSAPLGWDAPPTTAPLARRAAIAPPIESPRPLFLNGFGSGPDESGTRHFSVAFQPRLPAPYRQPAYQSIMAAMDPAALLQPDQAIPGQGSDTTGQNHFSTAFQPRLPPRAWNCFDPIENRLDRDSFTVGNFSDAQPDAMAAAPIVVPKRVPPIGNPFSTTDDTDVFSSSSVPIREIRGSFPPLEQRPLFSGSSPVIFVDSAAPQPFVAVRRQQSASQFEGGDVSSSLVPPPSMPPPVRRQPVLVTGGETLVLDLRYTADQEFAGCWGPLSRPTLPPSRCLPTADQAGLYGVLAPVGFISAPLTLPPGALRPLPNQGKGELVTDPGSTVPDAQLSEGLLVPPARENPFRPRHLEERPAFVDVGHEGSGAAVQPLAAPLIRQAPVPRAGETLLYAPPPRAVQVIVGCDLYAAVPARQPPPRQQPMLLPTLDSAWSPEPQPSMRETIARVVAFSRDRIGNDAMADIGHAEGVLQPLAAPVRRRAAAPSGGESLVLPVALLPTPIIVGWDVEGQLPAQASGAARLLPAPSVIITEPTPIFTPIQTPSTIRHSFRASPAEWRPIFADVPAAGEPLSNPAVVFSPARTVHTPGESLVYAPAPAPVEVIVGCDLYAVVPVRPLPPATQPDAQQPIIAQAVPLDFVTTGALTAPAPAPLATGHGQLTKVEAPGVPGLLAVPTFPPRRPTPTLVEPAPAPQGFQVLAGLDPMQCGAIAARMRPQAAGVLVIDQSSYRVPDVSGFQSPWPAPPRSAPRPVWQPIESISTTVFYGATGNPPAFVGVGQVLVAATDLWVFAPTAARIEVSQRGNRLTR